MLLREMDIFCREMIPCGNTHTVWKMCVSQFAEFYVQYYKNFTFPHPLAISIPKNSLKCQGNSTFK